MLQIVVINIKLADILYRQISGRNQSKTANSACQSAWLHEQSLPTEYKLNANAVDAGLLTHYYVLIKSADCCQSVDILLTFCLLSQHKTNHTMQMQKVSSSSIWKIINEAFSFTHFLITHNEYNPANENGLKWIENFNPF